MYKQIVISLSLLCLSPATLAESVTTPHTTSYNVFLIPSNQVNNTVSQISNQLSKQQLNTLYKQGYLPHITLYLTQYPSKNLPILTQKVKQIAHQWHRFNLTLSGIEQTKGHWLMLNVSNTKELQQLADTVTRTLAPLRSKDATVPTWVKHYPEKLNAFQHYGSPNVFTQFQPHITLLAQSQPQKLTAFMNNDGKKFIPINFNALGIGIAKVNTNGQAKTEITMFPFSK